ncbi:MAG: hypothetical protein FJ088_16925, partial [Deltaproteobacteria bacterium]|nr:hypothetical protein [Deltaproteobacteria bacterium]
SINSCVQDKCVNKWCVQVVKNPCFVKLPYLESFEIEGNWTSSGWKVVNLSGNADANWKFVESSELGPDRFLKFHWSPGAMNVKSVFVSPVIDVSGAKDITVQWDNIYKHYHGGVKLSLVAIPSQNPANAVEVWSANPNADMAFDIVSAAIPDQLVQGGSLQIGFMMDTSSTYNLDSWFIDRVKVKASLPPKIVEGISDIVMGVNDKISKTYKAVDPDHFTAPYVQTPIFNFYGQPFDAVPFANVQTQTFYNIYGEFFKPIIYDPGGSEAFAGIYNAGLIVREGGGAAETVSLESLHKFRITVIGNSGYLVWSPKGLATEDAIKIKDAIKQNGRAAQIIDDIAP